MDFDVSLAGGNIFHGAMGLDSLFLMRHVKGCSNYRTPLKGLYVCGSGAHPGDDVMGAPGRSATAQEYATEINIQDGSHIRTVELDHPDAEQVLEQITESDEGSLSASSFEKIDELSAQESEECAGNVEDTTSNKEELRDETISDERKCVSYFVLLAVSVVDCILM